MKNGESFLVRAVKTTDLAFGWISRVCVCICGALLVGVTLMLCAGVINRTFSNWVWLFVEEWGGLALIPISYLAFGYTLRQGRHLKMDLIVRRLSPKKKTILEIFSAAFSLVCMVFMIQFAVDWLKYTVVRGVVSSGPMQTPLSIFSVFVLVGLCLFAVDMLLFMINKVFDLRGNGGLSCKPKH